MAIDNKIIVVRGPTTHQPNLVKKANGPPCLLGIILQGSNAFGQLAPINNPTLAFL